MFDTKIVMVVKDDMPTWAKLNVCSFLVSGVIGNNSELIGQPYIDKNGHESYSLSRQPMIVLKSSSEVLKKIYQRSINREVKVSIFVEKMFFTNNDEDNRCVFKSFDVNENDIVGIGIYCDSKVADKITKGAKLHD